MYSTQVVETKYVSIRRLNYRSIIYSDQALTFFPTLSLAPPPLPLRATFVTGFSRYCGESGRRSRGRFHRDPPCNQATAPSTKGGRVTAVLSCTKSISESLRGSSGLFLALQSCKIQSQRVSHIYRQTYMGMTKASDYGVSRGGSLQCLKEYQNLALIAPDRWLEYPPASFSFQPDLESHATSAKLKKSLRPASYVQHNNTTLLHWLS